MTTLYIREVPEQVAAGLKERAAARGQSLSAYVNGELAQIVARPTNDQVVARLRSRDRSAGISSAMVLDELAATRR